MNKLKRAIMIAVLVLPKLAFAMPMLDVDINGQLLGATNVEVNNALYDVRFVDGICADVVTGCNGQGTFEFTDFDSATAASQALLDQVFLDGPNGNFDTDHTLTNGCGGIGYCNIFTAYELVLGTNDARSGLAQNLDGIAFPGFQDNAFVTSFDIGIDYSALPAITLAQWTVATPAPEPASTILLLLGLLGLKARSKRLF